MMRMARRYHLVPPHGTYYLNTGAILGPARHVLTYMEETCAHAQVTGNKDDQNTANGGPPASALAATATWPCVVCGPLASD